MTINERVAKIRARYFKGINKDFALAVKRSPNSTSGWLRNGTPVGATVIQALKDGIPTLNTEWLLTGEGVMDLTDKTTEGALFENYNTYLVTLVRQYAYAGYLSGFTDEEYMETLPKFAITAETEPKGDYLCIEVKGDSMEDATRDAIYEGDLLVCRNVEKSYWHSKLHINKWDFVIIHETEGILVKRIINHEIDTGDIVIHSLNPMYEDRVLNLSNVAKIMNIVDIRRSRRR